MTEPVHEDNHLPLPPSPEGGGWRFDARTFADMSFTSPSAKSKKKVRQFYKHQAELVDAFIALQKVQEESKYSVLAKNLEEETQNDEAAPSASVSFAVRGSLALNILLLIVKCIALYLSGSLSVVASLLDSALDLFSGMVLVVTNHIMERNDPHKYPAGKKRFEPLGVLVFSCVMCIASVNVLQEAVTALASQKFEELKNVEITVGILVGVIVLKFFMFLYCRRLRSNGCCDALASDHRNDVLTNSVGAVGVILSMFFSPLYDAIGGLVITLWVMSTWARTGYSQLGLLSGKSAPIDVLNQLTLLARNHHPHIVGVDTIRAYSGGGGYVVEIDLVLPPDMCLKDAHDIGESLQLLVERQTLIEVSRAYVHLDYETDHHPSDHR